MTRTPRARAVVAGSLVALLTAACGSSPSKSSPNSTTFTYWTSGWTPAQIDALDTAFDKAHPGLHAKGQYIASSDEYLPKVIAALKTDTQPTVLLTQNPSDLPEIEPSGKLIPLDGKLTTETNGLYPGIKNSLSYKGKQLGLALGGAGDIVLFYNKQDFKDAGITGPPASWTELAADAKKLSDPAKKHYGFYVPLGEAEWISWEWEALLAANGGTLLTPDGTKTAFNSPAGVKSLATWVDLIKNNSAPTTSFAQAGSFDGAPAFASHTVSLLIDGPWAVPNFQKAGIDFGVALFPKGDAGTATSIGIGVGALLKTTQAQDDAGVQFLKFLASPAEGAHLTAQSGGLPVDPSQLKQPELQTHIAGDPYYKVFSDNEASGVVRPLTPAYNAVSQALYTEISKALQDKETPADALANAARKGDSALSNQG
ncbi:MAG: hypothetical protein JWN00_5615 [Actinomycetia bacterium]|nr:hypothetical protein [Actinomycetes bacterium]